jgi:molybdate transport system ATP-binding protein
MAGLEHASLGRLVVNGEVWQDEERWLPAHKRSVGYVFQEASLFPHLTVLGNLRYGLKRSIYGRKVNLDQVVELFGIEHLFNRMPDHLSGGERQRVGIARALAVGPRLLLMDEPLATLDLKRMQEVLPYLERLHSELDIPVIYVSHSPAEVGRLGDHLVAMEAGKVLANGPLAAMLARLDLPLRLGEDTGVILDAIVGAVDKDWHLSRVDFGGGSLWTRNHGLPIGHRVRVRVLARDVSLATDLGKSSIQNVLRGKVDAIADEEDPGITLVRVRVGEVMLLARLTRRAATSLGLVSGQELWVQVKSVALME